MSRILVSALFIREFRRAHGWWPQLGTPFIQELPLTIPDITSGRSARHIQVACPLMGNAVLVA